MILQALTNHYEALAAKGEIPRDGWAGVKVSWALELTADGKIKSVMPISETETRKGKAVEIPRVIPMPAPFKRSSGIQSNFLCDNAAYILGASKSDSEKDMLRALDCFAAAKSFHLEILSGCDSAAAHAVCAFFEKWDPKASPPLIEPILKDSATGGITFYTNGRFATEDEDIAGAWQNAYQNEENGQSSVCLVTGKSAVPAAVHPAVKGVKGAQSSGAALVSFNADSFTSFGKEQSLNAPVSKYAAFAYTTALNHLLADSAHRKFIGDATVVYWAENGEQAGQDFMTALFDGGDDRISDEVLDNTVKSIVARQAVDFEGLTISPNDRFFILALSPNNARVSVRFFYDTDFGDIACNFKRFYDELEITGAKKFIPLWQILNETARKTPDGKANPSPEISGEMLRSVITGCDFPETFYQSILLRIRSEKEIRSVKAAAIKAFLLRNRKNHPDFLKYKEVLSVKLNEETTYLPYVLGELFAVLEAVQENASNVTTIKDRYFTSACTAPAVVFPRLIELANHHLRKMDGGTKVFYAREIGTLMTKIGESYPAQMNLNDQGIFQIGYYHKKQKRFEGKSKENNMEE